MEVPFVKGHGTENDFVLLPDPDGALELTGRQVAALCDRRAGLGADGVLRVAPGSSAPWFMDYRNADGSVAEMCGNGIRVFARYLVESGLAPAGEVPIETRAGVLVARVDRAGDVTVELGSYELPDLTGVSVAVARPGGSWPATAVRLPNPHVVVLVRSLDEAGSLRTAPAVAPTDAFPDGANVEFVVRTGRRSIAMRVHERGVGETRSCGTGAGAAAVATVHQSDDLPIAGPVTLDVTVPGGALAVTIFPDRKVELTGPAVLVARGTVELVDA